MSDGHLLSCQSVSQLRCSLLCEPEILVKLKEAGVSLNFEPSRSERGMNDLQRKPNEL